MGIPINSNGVNNISKLTVSYFDYCLIYAFVFPISSKTIGIEEISSITPLFNGKKVQETYT